MESPAGTRRASTGRRRWAAPVVVLLLSVVVAGWLLLPGDEGDVAAPARVSLGSDDATPGSGPMAPAAATIIEEAPVAGDAGLVAGSLPEADTAAAAGAGVAVPDAGTASAPANPFAAAPATRARPQPAPTLAPGRQPRSGDEPDLLAVLLGNIRSGDSSTAGRDVDGLDALIQSMQANETATAGAAEPARAGRPLRTRSEQIQSNLRECPPPNTPQGLRCRQEICAVYAGRDPACPAG